MKPRIALTIAYNGMNHLHHSGFVDFMVKHFNLWVIVEGSARNGGSTSWCKHMDTPHRSKDGTAEYIETLAAQYPNVMAYSHHKHYRSKDEQVNKGIEIIKTKYNSGWLWQVDVDEHWKAEDLASAENELWRLPYTAAEFQFNHYVKDDIIAVGKWGSGWVTRLWKWRGESFRSHEPAVLNGQKGATKLPYKFDHYSLIFEDDVKFKARFYKGHEQMYLNWKKLDTLDWSQPNHVSCLFGTNNVIGRSDTYLIKLSSPCANVLNQEGRNADTADGPMSLVTQTIAENNAPIIRNRKYHRPGGRGHAKEQGKVPGAGIAQRPA